MTALVSLDSTRCSAIRRLSTCSKQCPDMRSMSISILSVSRLSASDSINLRGSEPVERAVNQVNADDAEACCCNTRSRSHADMQHDLARSAFGAV